MSASDIGIVTLCDSEYFQGLLMLHRSVQECFPCNMVCYDIGLNPEQKARTEKLANLQILPLPDDPLIGRIEVAMRFEPPLKQRVKRVWPLWICPIIIKNAPFRDVIWMDCDIVVLRNLSELFASVAVGPVFTPDNNASGLNANHPDLYKRLQIQRPFDQKIPAVNAGVSGWRKDRDEAAIDAYIYVVEQAVVDKEIRDLISWHDQGALIWAIQFSGLEHRVAGTNIWNLCAKNTSIADRPIPWNDKFLEVARERVKQANILHWNSCRRPWVKGPAK